MLRTSLITGLVTNLECSNILEFKVATVILVHATSLAVCPETG